MTKLSRLYKDFFDSEKAGGLILVFVTILSLIIANSPFQKEYISFWNTELGGHNIVHWINDGLMAIFFLLIGLELERELYVGELSNLKNASLPIFGAIGGMLVPAGLYTLFNIGTDLQAGAGIPMATDIAFAIGILSLLGNRVPASLKIFLTALAVIDDLGAIIVIAVFYTSSISMIYLFAALGVFCLLLVFNKLRIYNLTPYIIGGVVMWYFMLHSGVHATISGILLAFAIPFDKGNKKSPSTTLQHFLHKPVAYLILPIFALANTSINIGTGLHNIFEYTNSIGIMAGLIAGKPLGIFLFTFIGAGIGLCSLPKDIKWKNILATGFLGGIGFTMSIFITALAFDNEETIRISKLAIS